LLLILHDKPFKEGLMKLNIKRLDNDVGTTQDNYIASKTFPSE